MASIREILRPLPNGNLLADQDHSGIGAVPNVEFKVYKTELPALDAHLEPKKPRPKNTGTANRGLRRLFGGQKPSTSATQNEPPTSRPRDPSPQASPAQNTPAGETGAPTPRMRVSDMEPEGQLRVRRTAAEYLLEIVREDSSASDTDLYAGLNEFAKFEHIRFSPEDRLGILEEVQGRRQEVSMEVHTQETPNEAPTTRTPKPKVVHGNPNSLVYDPRVKRLVTIQEREELDATHGPVPASEPVSIQEVRTHSPDIKIGGGQAKKSGPNPPASGTRPDTRDGRDTFDTSGSSESVHTQAEGSGHAKPLELADLAMSLTTFQGFTRIMAVAEGKLGLNSADNLSAKQWAAIFDEFDRNKGKKVKVGSSGDVASDFITAVRTLAAERVFVDGDDAIIRDLWQQFKSESVSGVATTTVKNEKTGVVTKTDRKIDVTCGLNNAGEGVQIGIEALKKDIATLDEFLKGISAEKDVMDVREYVTVCASLMPLVMRDKEELDGSRDTILDPSEAEAMFKTAFSHADTPFRFAARLARDRKQKQGINPALMAILCSKHLHTLIGEGEEVEYSHPTRRTLARVYLPVALTGRRVAGEARSEETMKALARLMVKGNPHIGHIEVKQEVEVAQAAVVTDDTEEDDEATSTTPTEKVTKTGVIVGMRVTGAKLKNELAPTPPRMYAFAAEVGKDTLVLTDALVDGDEYIIPMAYSKDCPYADQGLRLLTWAALSQGGERIDSILRGAIAANKILGPAGSSGIELGKEVLGDLGDLAKWIVDQAPGIVNAGISGLEGLINISAEGFEKLVQGSADLLGDIAAELGIGANALGKLLKGGVVTLANLAGQGAEQIKTLLEGIAGGAGGLLGNIASGLGSMVAGLGDISLGSGDGGGDDGGGGDGGDGGDDGGGGDGGDGGDDGGGGGFKLPRFPNFKRKKNEEDDEEEGSDDEEEEGPVDVNNPDPQGVLEGATDPRTSPAPEVIVNGYSPPVPEDEGEVVSERPPVSPAESGREQEGPIVSEHGDQEEEEPPSPVGADAVEAGRDEHPEDDVLQQPVEGVDEQVEAVQGGTVFEAEEPAEEDS